MKIVSHAYLLANAIVPTYECAMLICPMYLLQFSGGPILNKKSRATLSVVNLIAHAIGVTRNILAACSPCISPSIRPAAHNNAAPSSQPCWRLGESRCQERHESAWSLPRRSNAARARPGAERKRATWSSPGSF